MNLFKNPRTHRAWLFAAALMIFTLPLRAQEPTEKIVFDKPTLRLQVGETAEVKVQLQDLAGQPVRGISLLLYARGNTPSERRSARQALEISPRSSDSTGTVIAKVTARKPGSWKFMARKAVYRANERLQDGISVEVAFPALKRITFVEPPKKLYVGTTMTLKTRVFDSADLEREGVDVSLSSSDPQIASVDAFGNVTAHKSGTLSIRAGTENIRSSLDIRVVQNPVASLELRSSLDQARTGDVIRFEAIASDELGRKVSDAPIQFTFTARPDDNLGPPASGQIEPDGRFVAETPGIYTILAKSGPSADQKTVRITQRDVSKKVEVVGHGLVGNVLTSDLWVWEGIDGRDYAVTGTWGANGEAYFWDVTDPANMTIIDTVTVDARTVNDVKVSEDGRICVISREGASTRRNGFVIIDVSNPRETKIIAKYDDELTGGVHNVFIDNNHVYAVNNGRRYDIINIEDPTQPYRVGRFELDTPGHAIHDVWIENGIAYSSNWQDGLQLVDVGGLKAQGPFKTWEGLKISDVDESILRQGGSPSNPLKFASYAYPSGANHAAFPFFSQSVEKFYVVAGDESFPYPDYVGYRGPNKKPTIAAGYMHFVDFTDLKNPKEVARYEVPEAGSHNLWIDGDVMYAAFYNGGLRVVDISGELLGDLYRQGREIAWFLPMHPEARIPNASMVWGPQPYKGLIYFSDMNSGLWAVRLVPREGTN